jgi:hypothetical protein
MGLGLGLGIGLSYGGGPSAFNALAVSGANLWLQNGVGMATSAFTDSSGQGNTMAAGIAPTLVTNQIAGRSVLRGVAASNQSMATAGGCPGGNAPHTTFIVGRINAMGSVFCGMFGYGGSNTGYGSSVIGMDNTNKAWFGGANATTPVGAAADTSFHVYSKTFDGTTIKGFIDGVQVATLGSVTMALSTIMTLFRYAAPATGFISCDIAEVVNYNSALSAANYALINRGLGAKFGLVQP